MRMVYVDEAGISNPAQEPFITVAGVIVYADNSLRAVENHLGRLVDQHITANCRKDFVSFHATEIFNGGKVMDRKDPYWSMERRLKIADDLAAIPRKFRLPIALGHSPRAEIAEIFKESALSERDLRRAGHSIAYLHCAIQVEHWLRDNASNEVCMMIVEDNDNIRELLKGLQRENQDPKLAALRDELGDHLPFRKIKEDPLFQPKKHTSPLQIADFCAYVFKRVLMDQSDPRFRRFYAPIAGMVATFSEEKLAKKRDQRMRLKDRKQDRERSS